MTRSLALAALFFTACGPPQKAASPSAAVSSATAPAATAEPVAARTPAPGFPAGLKPCQENAPEGESCARGAAAATPTDDIWRVPVTADDPVKGPADALVTVVLFSDFECPFCRKASAMYEKLLAELPQDVRLVWKDCPLTMH